MIVAFRAAPAKSLRPERAGQRPDGPAHRPCRRRQRLGAIQGPMSWRAAGQKDAAPAGNRSPRRTPRVKAMTEPKPAMQEVGQ